MSTKTPTPPQLFNDNTPMPFGRYRGKAMINVPAVYLLWLHDNGCDHAGVKQYINDNFAALRSEAAKVKR